MTQFNTEPQDKDTTLDEYTLDIGDLLKIPEDRFDDFVIDLKKWHKSVKATVDTINEVAKAIGEPPVVLGTMRWIDDGKHNGKITIEVKETPNED